MSTTQMLASAPRLIRRLTSSDFVPPVWPDAGTRRPWATASRTVSALLETAGPLSWSDRVSLGWAQQNYTAQLAQSLASRHGQPMMAMLGTGYDIPSILPQSRPGRGTGPLTALF
jgi:hypothetical protein